LAHAVPLAVTLMLAGILAGASGVAAAAGPAGAPAAANASDAEVRRMIESLRPAASPGRTRNLVVEAAPAAAPSPAAATATPGPSAGAAPAAPAAAAGPPSAAPSDDTTGSGLSLAIGFEPNSAQLRPDNGATLGALVAAMLSPELRRSRFVIEGHTDAVGSPAQNLRLSRERAEQVRLFLVTLGVDGERLRAVGKGSSEPVNARDPRAPENRRVRVVALP
jgi:outer membrane protein OmpA-like peptidoglycan-associated protein